MLNTAAGEIVYADGDDDVFLRTGDGIELDGKLYIVQSRSAKPRGFIVEDPEAPGIAHPMSNREIKDWHRRGRLWFVAPTEFDLPIGIRESLRRSMRAFSKRERKEMFRRLRYCKAIDSQGPDFRRGEVSMQPVCDAVANERDDRRSHDWATVNQWWKDWARAGRDVRALCPSTRRRGNREQRLEPYMAAALQTGLQGWLRGGKPRMSTHYNQVVKECVAHHGGEEVVKKILEEDNDAWLWPSYKTFTLACRALDRTTKLARRDGPKAARYQMYPVGEGPDVRLPFERVEADFKYLRIFIVDEKTGAPLGTPYLMAAIDCFSGVVAGFDIGFDPPSYNSAARCLKHVIDFKEMGKFPPGEDGRPIIKNSYPVNGVPRQFVLDNDAAFHAKSFERSANALGCHIDFLPPGSPWDKGKMERFWGTVQTSYVDMFPGNVLRLGPTPGKDYDASKDAVLTLSQLRLFITKAIADVHHIGIEPGTYQRRIDIWNEGVERNPPRPVPAHESLLELVGAYEQRKAERRGIRLFGLRYNSPELAQYRSGFEKDPTVEVRYDPQDISVIWVIDKKGGKPFSVPCTRKDDYAAGLSEHQHKVIQRRAKEVAGFGRLRMAELLLAKQELFAIGMAMLGGRRSRRTNARLAHFLGIGRELIDEMSRRREDMTESAAHLDVEKEEVEDPEDEVKARADEDEMDRVMEGVAATSVPEPTPEKTKPDPEPEPEPVAAPASVPSSVRPRRRASTMKVSYDD